MSIESVNPANGEILATYTEVTPQESAAALEEAWQAFLSWRDLAFSERAQLVRAAGRLLRDGREDHAGVMTREMGKPIAQSRAEVDKCAWVCDFYAEEAEAFLKPEPVKTDASRSFVAYEPIGVVLGVMPWNFPFWQVFRFAVPALMAGNTAVLKHASNVPGCALAIGRIFEEAGFPRGTFRALLAGSGQVAALIENPRVMAVSLTGSTPAGQAVAAKAGAALKKTVLELGGSDPYVILSDADLDAAVEACVTSRLINSGQSCVSAKRFIVPDTLRNEFESAYVYLMRSKRMGDPFDESNDIGPQARHDLRDELHRQVTSSVGRGARCLLGGTVPDGPGAFYPPTVLTDVGAGMPAYDEELFGPVAAIIPVKDENKAIDVANDSRFGLGAAVFTRDVARGEQIAARRLQAGNCFVNAFVRSDVRLPFGGVKQSGYGRELGVFGIREFVNIKTVWVA